jgi:gliding motility-associated-like protein
MSNLIHVYPTPVADFYASPSFTTDIYNSTVNFYDASTGTIQTWNWNIAGLQSSTAHDPVYTFGEEGIYPVTLIVTSPNGCADTITKEVVILPDYTFYAPNAFTPNGDGTNEQFRPVGTAWDINKYNLWVFDRWGNQVFFTQDTTRGWDGTKQGNDVQQDTYVWKVRLHDIFGTQHEYNGQINLVR